MARRKLSVALFIVFTLSLASQAIAASAVQAAGAATPAISWFYVHHRTFEADPAINRLSVGFKDASSGVPLLGDNLTSLTLYDPNGDEVPVPQLTFYPAVYEIDGEYDGKTGIWNYGEPYLVADYRADLDQELVVGTYHLVAVFDGVELEASFNFTGVVDLPIVPASSIKSKIDASGNLICTWAVSYELSKHNPSLATWTRVGIEVKKKGKIIGGLWYRVPTHLGRVFVPKEVIDAIKGFGGSNYTIGIMVRTNDNSTRAHSKTRKLNL